MAAPGRREPRKPITRWVWLENDAIGQQPDHNERNVCDDRKQKQHTPNTPQGILIRHTRTRYSGWCWFCLILRSAISKSHSQQWVHFSCSTRTTESWPALRSTARKPSRIMLSCSGLRATVHLTSKPKPRRLTLRIEKQTIWRRF